MLMPATLGAAAPAVDARLSLSGRDLQHKVLTSLKVAAHGISRNLASET
jgi:hypothetical protein